VSLSNFCPTAVSLLFRDEGVLDVDTDVRVSATRGPLEGLDMRGALPPLLKPDLLFTWFGFALWEREVVRQLGEMDRPLHETLANLAGQAERLRTWTPHCGPFDAWVTGILDARAPDGPPRGPLATPETCWATYRTAHATVEPTLAHDLPSIEVGRMWPAVLAATEPPFARVVRRYLASRVWASWVAHEGGGVRSYIRWIEMIRAVLAVEVCRAVFDANRPLDAALLADAIRAADLLLVHLSSPSRLARVIARSEHVPLGPTEPQFV
jgi:hypothetical protein